MASLNANVLFVPTANKVKKAKNLCSLNLPSDGKIRDLDNNLFSNKTGVQGVLRYGGKLHDGIDDWVFTFDTDNNGGMTNINPPLRTSLTSTGQTVLFLWSEHSGSAFATGYNQGMAQCTITLL